MYNQNWRAEEIRKSINSWYLTKLDWQNYAAKFDENDITELHQRLSEVNKLKLDINILFNKYKR